MNLVHLPAPPDMKSGFQYCARCGAALHHVDIASFEKPELAANSFISTTCEICLQPFSTMAIDSVLPTNHVRCEDTQRAKTTKK